MTVTTIPVTIKCIYLENLKIAFSCHHLHRIDKDMQTTKSGMIAGAIANI